MSDVFVEMRQGSNEWKQARAGSLGASDIADARARIKTGWGASRAALMARLLIERLTGQSVETYQSQAMRNGIEREPMARLGYEIEKGVTVVEIGLVRHPIIRGTHASPDGLVGDDGLVEIKCPEEAAHLDFLLTRQVPDRYHQQVQWQMCCAGRSWCDVVFYNPNFPGPMQLAIERVERNDRLIEEMEVDARGFLDELASKVAALLEAYGLEESAA
jgi:putative phage-type endonuclease